MIMTREPLTIQVQDRSRSLKVSMNKLEVSEDYGFVNEVSTKL